MSPVTTGLSALLVGILICQVPSQTFVLPSKFTNVQGNDAATLMFPHTDAQPSHVQYVLSAADAPVNSAIVKALSLRKNAAQPNPPQATASIRLELSVGPSTPDKISSLFAQNHGPNRTVVFQGNIQLPASMSPGPPFPFEVPILFSTPFSFDKSHGSGFVVDLYLFGTTPMNGWAPDGAKDDLGRRLDNGPHALPHCAFSTGRSLRYGNGTNDNGVVPGSPWTVTNSQSEIPPFAVGVGTLGRSGAGSSYAGKQLPIDMGPLGAPGCHWSVASIVFMLLQADSRGNVTWSITLPNDSRLVGTSFFEQSLWSDPPANPLGLVVGPTSRWIIGSGAPPGGSTLFMVKDDVQNPRPYGFVHLDWTAIVQFSY